MGRIVGIDLGTTYSLIAYMDAATNEPKCIVGPYGSALCPSVVSVDADGIDRGGRSGAAAIADAIGAHDLFREAPDGARRRKM